jgi:acyl-CoA dehydrogenase
MDTCNDIRFNSGFAIFNCFCWREKYQTLLWTYFRMIDFQLTSEQQDFQEDIREFAVTCLRPFAAEADRIGDIPAAMFRPEILNAMQAFLPLEFGGGWPGKHNGRRLDIAWDPLLRVIMNEEAAYGDAALFIALPGPGLTVPIVDTFGTPEQKRQLFSIFAGQPQPNWAAFAMSEPGAGSDFAALSTTAREEKDCYVLNGTKWFAGNGLRAEWIIVFASVNPGLGRFGIRAFIVERGTPGFTANLALKTMGLRAVQIAELQLHECRIAKQNLLSPVNAGKKGGFDGSLLTLQQFRPAVAAMAIGTSRAALDEAEKLIQQNGASHSGARRWHDLKSRLASLRVRVQAARLICWKAAWLQHTGGDAFSHTSMAKAFAARVVMETCATTMEIAGAAALHSHSLFEKFQRDAKAFDLLEGTGDIHRLMLSRALLRNSPVPAA